VVFDDPVTRKEESKVIVVFLEESKIKPKLVDIFERYGPWEDNRTADEIVVDTRNSRIVGADIHI